MLMLLFQGGGGNRKHADDLPYLQGKKQSGWLQRERRRARELREDAPRTGFMKPPGVRSLCDPNTCPEPPHSCCWLVPFTYFCISIPETPTVGPWLRISLQLLRVICRLPPLSPASRGSRRPHAPIRDSPPNARARNHPAAIPGSPQF
jgi:hypothetical protein